MIPIVEHNVEEVEFILNYISTNIVAYNLYNLTSKAMGDKPSIVKCHPLALEYGQWLQTADEGNYESILPAVGIELLDDDEYETQYLGSGRKFRKISQDYIDDITALELKNRYKEGVIISDDNIVKLQAAKTAKLTDDLWAKEDSYLQSQVVAISIWSDKFELTRILYLVMRGLLKKLKHELSGRGVKNCRVRGQGGLYNYEFNQTLFGAEFTLTFINGVKIVDVDDTINTIKGVEESFFSEDVKSKPTFVGLKE